METPQSDINETLITLASDIVAAHVSNNSVSVDDVAPLISKVQAGLSTQAPGSRRSTPVDTAHTKVPRSRNHA